MLRQREILSLLSLGQSHPQHMSHRKDIRTSESVESHNIDNQTMCISIPRWNLWFELKEHQIAP